LAEGRNGSAEEIPDEALDSHTRQGKAKGRGMQFFLDESTKLVQFEGDLTELEDEYRVEVQQTVNGEVRERPKNPWGEPRSRPNDRGGHAAMTERSNA
jgi:hypothetical protein